jgi:ATP adenylyltransferase
MEQIFTPWRLAYLTSDHTSDDCVFCSAVAPGEDERRLILRRSGSVYVILNLYPYSSGHLMVVPNRHVAGLSLATPEERGDMIETAAACEAILAGAYRPAGFNIGMNLGRAAGAGIAGHLHLHVVPRWDGDTNFATVLGGTRIIPETPEQTYRRLRPLFDATAGAGRE